MGRSPWYAGWRDPKAGTLEFHAQMDSREAAVAQAERIAGRRRARHTALMTITSPRQDPDHPDRHIDCAAALEPAFEQVEAAGIAAGWTPDEVAIALMDLAKNSLLALAENRKTQAAIDVARLLERLKGPGS